jgi:hypothetical protein
MSERWTDVVRELGDFDPPLALWAEVERRVTAPQSMARAATSPQRAGRSLGRRWGGWVLAGAGAAVVLLLLALAAHSRREQPAGGTPRRAATQRSTQTPTGLRLTYPKRWHAMVQRNVVYPGTGIVLASYPISPHELWWRARETRPDHGTLVLIADIHPQAAYLPDAMFSPRPAHLTLGRFGSFEGLGNGYRVTFTDKGHAIAVFVATDHAGRSAAEKVVNSIRIAQQRSLTVPTDPTASLVRTKVVPLDRSSGFGGPPGATVLAGLAAKDGAPAAAEWWANVLAIAANARGGHVVGVDIVTSPADLNEGRPSARLRSHGAWSGLSTSEILAAVRRSAKQQGFTITHLAVHTTSAGPDVSIVATPTNADAIDFLKHHGPLHVAVLYGKAASFTEITDSTGHLLLTDGEVPNDITTGWTDRHLRCQDRIGMAARQGGQC